MQDLIMSRVKRLYPDAVSRAAYILRCRERWPWPWHPQYGPVVPITARDYIDAVYPGLLKSCRFVANDVRQVEQALLRTVTLFMQYVMRAVSASCVYTASYFVDGDGANDKSWAGVPADSPPVSYWYDVMRDHHTDVDAWVSATCAWVESAPPALQMQRFLDIYPFLSYLERVGKTGGEELQLMLREAVPPVVGTIVCHELTELKASTEVVHRLHMLAQRERVEDMEPEAYSQIVCPCALRGLAPTFSALRFMRDACWQAQAHQLRTAGHTVFRPRGEVGYQVVAAGGALTSRRAVSLLCRQHISAGKSPAHIVDSALSAGVLAVETQSSPVDRDQIAIVFWSAVEAFLRQSHNPTWEQIEDDDQVLAVIAADPVAADGSGISAVPN